MLTVEAENRLPLSEALKRFAKDSNDALLSEFYRWLDERYDSDEYDKVRGRGNWIDPKFLAVCWRTKRLMSLAYALSWHRKKKLATLDLGSGPGHLGLIATFLGHTATGLDCYSLFDPLREFWGQSTVPHRIEADTPLPVGKFDSITSILTNYGRTWSVDQWDSFVSRLLDDHLTPGGEFAISFPGDPELPYRRHLRERASRVERRLMIFTKGVEP